MLKIGKILNMKKRGLALALYAIFIFALSLASVSAATNVSEGDKVNMAYNWLSGQVSAWPSGDDGSLALMALAYDDALKAKGVDALMASSFNSGQCWPSSGCKVKSTALAVLALTAAGQDTTIAEEWLGNQIKAYTDTSAEWYLQIDSGFAANCHVKYDGKDYSFNISIDKKINKNAGSCLAIGTYGYKISSSCLEKVFTVTCDSDFVVSMMYKKGVILYPISTTQSGFAGSWLESQIQTFCLIDSGVCNYEGTLWASYALKTKGQDVSKFVPYIIGFSSDFSRFVPEAFLYYATADVAYADSLLGKANPAGYLILSGDKVYDTSIAILGLGDYNIDAKDKAKSALLASQVGDGSLGNIKDTAIALYVFWSKAAGIGPVTNACESRGYSCKAECAAGEKEETSYDSSCQGLICCSPVPAVPTCSSQNYLCCDECDSGHQADLDNTCYAGQQCCSKCKSGKSCSELGGEICNPGTSCSVTAITSSDGDCCTGQCQEITQTCTQLTGAPCADATKCTGTFSYASDGGCCVGGTCKAGGISIWIIILSILVVGAAVYFLNKKGILKFKKKPKPGTPGAPAQPSARPVVRPLVPVQPAPQAQARSPVKPQPTQPPKTSKKDEFEETFRKLKEI